MTRHISILVLALTSLAVACDSRSFLTCEDGTTDGAEDAWFDVENCNEWGTTNNSGDGASSGYDECYHQAYDSIYIENIEEFCGEGFD